LFSFGSMSVTYVGVQNRTVTTKSESKTGKSLIGGMMIRRSL
jgi:hypothetical protein